jgi:hypothetical protein
MPGTVNGIGTAVCPAGGGLSWSTGPWYSQGYSRAHYDGVECVVVFYLPLIPYKAVHIFNRQSAGMGEQYQQIPIRWSLGLVLRAFFGRWLWAVLFVGATMAVIGAVDTFQHHKPHHMLFAVGLGVTALAPLGWWLLAWSDRRNRDLRRVMGPTEFGSSDPVTWGADTLQHIRSAKELFGESTYAAAARKFLADEAFGQAMFAARCCAAFDDRHEGEVLTDEILQHPAVVAGLSEVRRDPSQWPVHFGKGLVAPA